MLITYIIGVACIVLASSLLLSTNIVRDDVDSSKPRSQRPYSLSRTQLLWWTCIVFVSFIAVMECNHWVVHPDLPIFSETALILLGISLGTTAAGRAIDNVDKNKIGSLRHQEHLDPGSRNLLKDICSDQNGLSIHRLQQVLFTFAFGVLFLYTAVFKGYMPDFDDKWLALIGASASGYMVIKVTENKKSSGGQQPNPPNPPSDLIDPIDSKREI